MTAAQLDFTCVVANTETKGLDFPIYRLGGLRCVVKLLNGYDNLSGLRPAIMRCRSIWGTALAGMITQRDYASPYEKHLKNFLLWVCQSGNR